jgi:hypothetical protein
LRHASFSERADFVRISPAVFDYFAFFIAACFCRCVPAGIFLISLRMNSQKPLSVLHVCTSRSWGGMEMRALQTSLSLQARGLRVTLLCFPNSTLHREAQAAGIGVFPAPFRRALQPLLILRLRRFLRARRFDLMHTHFSKDLLLIVPAAEGLLPRLPIVLTKRVGSGVSKKDFLHRYL